MVPVALVVLEVTRVILAQLVTLETLVIMAPAALVVLLVPLATQVTLVHQVTLEAVAVAEVVPVVLGTL
jgi:hypothetical protein